MPKSTNYKIEQPTVLLIFGMHRSGTSAFAGLLKESGIPMGKDLMKAAYDNPRGFYENEKVVAINEKILNILGQSWDVVFELPEKWTTLKQLEILAIEATHYIQTNFKETPLFALKDPRFSLTLLFWTPIFKKLGINIKQYILVRHPHEVAQSLWKRNQMPKQMAMALWTKYMMHATQQATVIDSQFISFEKVLSQPLALVQELEKTLNISLRDSEEIADAFINNSLRHHQTNEQIVDPFLRECYELLLNQTKGEIDSTNLLTLQNFAKTAEYQSLVPRKALFATLAMDYGQGINEKAPKKIVIQLDTSQLTFELNTPLAENSKPLQFHFYPANTLASLTIKNIYLQFEHGVQTRIHELIPTALINYQNNYVFKENGFIEFYPPQESAIKQVVIELVYHKIGQWAYADIASLSQQMKEDFDKELSALATGKTNAKKLLLSTKNRKTKGPFQKSNFWLTFLKTGLRSPMAFVKNINTENFNTLRKALLNEPPSVILSNLKKLLLNGGQATTNNWKHTNQSVDRDAADTSFDSIQRALEKPIAELPKGKKNGRILYFATSLPDFDTSSGGKRAARYLTLLAADFEVYVYSLTNQSPKYSTYLEQHGIQVLPQMDYAQLQKEIPCFRAIICSTYTIFAEAEQLITYYPNAQIILDTVDVHWLREERSIDLVEELTREKVQLAKSKEIAVYQKVDSIWAVTHQDKLAIQKELPIAKVDIISNVHELEVESYVDNGKNSLLFIGSYRHTPNISAVKKLALDIFPPIKAAIPTATLILAGAHAPKEIIVLGDLEGITFKGFIEEADLPNLYQETFLSVSPLLAGAGIKGKICEAIAFKTPVVTNAIGNEGIYLVNEKEGLIAEVNSMAATIIKGLRREYDFAEMTHLAAQKLEKLVGAKGIQEKLLTAFFPAIAICIVTWNRLELLKKCLESIELNTRYPNYKVVVYSNACTDGTVDYLKDLAQKNNRLIPVFSATNKVFVRPNNEMMRRFSTSEIVLLNNDTQVTENWLLELHRAAYASKTIGIAGAKILYPDGRLQEFGAELYAEGNGLNIGKGENPKRAIYQKLKTVGYVSGCAMYLKRSTINQIGVFDDQFHPCYYEDSDYCYTAAEQGLKTVVTPHSIIYHEEGGTAGTDTTTGFKRYQEINRQKFIQKHQGKNNGIHWPTDNPQLATFIFTHIPKCGGTSFRKFINEAALENGLKTTEMYIPGLNGIPDAKNLAQLSSNELANLQQRPLKILANHSKFEAHTALGIRLQKPFYYTILREPISRFISHYNFFYYEQGLDSCKGIPFEELPKEKQQYLIGKMANLQISYLTNALITPQSDMPKLLKKAQSNLEVAYADFGILEDMEMSIQRLKEKAPAWLKITKDFPVLNKNKTQMAFSSAIIKEIEVANYWDIQLYNWAKAQSVQSTTSNQQLVTSNS